jgi:hypothetical protein
MKKAPVDAGTFCPLSVLVFYILTCWKYLPVSGARLSPCCYGKIPEKSQIKNVRKNCRRFTAWEGEVQDLDIFSNEVKKCNSHRFLWSSENSETKSIGSLVYSF